MKADRSRKRRLFLIANKLVSVITLIFFSAGTVFALPAGQQVVNGQASFATQGNNLTITNSPNSIINWQGFSINNNEAVRFIQQYGSSAVLNRVIGQDPSRIFGLLQSNGRVFLINPSGILFGQGARIDVNGLFASTLNIGNQDFLAGKYNFTAGAVAGSIQNQATITTPEGGKVYLIAPDIENSGIINSPKGDVILAAGHSVQLVDSLNPDISIVVSAPENKSVNLGQIVAQSGKVGIYGGLISQKGIVNADSAVMEGGRIFLKATKSIELADTSVISADGTKGGQIIVMTEENGQISGTLTGRGLLSAQGDGSRDSGGFIETSAAKVDLNGIRVRTNGGNWLLDPYDFTIAASGGDITGSALGSALNSNSVTIQTTVGSASCTGATCTLINSGVNGDIFVNDTVSWSASTLTLSAYRNIYINSVLNGSGDAKLALEYGQGAPAAGNTATYSVNAPVNLPAGLNFSTKLGSNGPTVAYTVITSLGAAADATTPPGTATLQGMAATTNLSGKYALGSNIDATDTSGWDTLAGFTPVGNNPASPVYGTVFTGTFDGLGHTITGLSINRLTTDHVGLFGYTGSSAKIRNVGLVNGNITGNNYVGGLVGKNYRGTISNSYSTGEVTVVTGSGGYGGGLVGYNAGYGGSGSISNSYSTGKVTVGSGGYGGGLVGYNDGHGGSSSISNSYSTVAVTVGSGGYGGGLVGYNDGYGGSSSISNSYSTGVVTVTGSGGYGGGLVGYNDGHGGSSSSSISNSYSTGAVTVGSGGYGGGLVGYNDGNGGSGRISNSYSTGAVNVTGGYGGGLMGWNNGGTISSSYWDKDTSGKTTSAGGTGLTTTQMMQLASFSSWNTATLNTIANTGGSGAVWRIYEGHTAPLLTSFMTGLTLTDAPDVSKTYNSYTQSGATTAISGVLGVAASGTNAGFYNGYYSTQQGYDITGGNLTINAASAGLSAISLSGTRAYDGTVNVDHSIFTLTGLVDGQTLTLDGVGTVADKNVGNNKAVTLNTLALGNGTGSASNYTFSGGTQKADITQASLTLSTSNVTKTYDGGLTAAGTAVVTSGTLFSGDTLSGGNFAFTDKNVGISNKTVTATATAVTVNDGNSGGNYIISYADNTASTINPYAVSMTGSRAYDGTVDVAAGIFTLGTLVGTETLTLAGTGTVANKNVGTAKAVTLGSLALGNGTGLASNYTFSGGTQTADITPAALTVTAAGVNKVYDGLTGATVTLADNRVAGDILTTAYASAAYPDKNVAAGKTVNVSGITLTNTDAGNYTFNTTAATTADITAKPLTITGFASDNKVYNANTTAVISAAGSLSGVETGDTVNFTNTGATFDTKDVGTDKTVTLNGVTLTGTGDQTNYSYSATTTDLSNITAKPLTITGFASDNKVYDRLTTAVISAAGSLSGVETGDTVNFTNTGATFDTKDVGTDKTVTLNGVTLTGTGDQTNYSYSATTTDLSNITARALTITAATNTKVYDGNTSAAAAPAITSGSLAGGDTAALTEVSDSKTAGTGKTLTPSAVISDGNSGNNYLVTYVNNTTGVIDPGQIVSGMLDVAAAEKTIYFAVNGTLLSDWASTDASGNYSGMFPLNSIPNNSALLVYVANDGSVKSASVYLAAGGDIANLLLSSNTVTGSSGGSMSTATFGIAKGALSSGDIPYSVSGNDLTLSSGFNLIMKAGGDITLNGLINAGTGNVTLNSGGAIINGMGGLRSISAGFFFAEAVNGIGSGDPLMTGVNNITALNTIANHIQIDNTGVLTVSGMRNLGTGNVILQNIGKITTDTSAVTSSGGTVSITAHSPLTIGSGGVSASGNISLEASPSGGSDDLTINGNIASSNGNIILRAGSSIVLGPGSGLSAPKGTITMTDGLNAPTGNLVVTGNKTATGNTLVALKTTEGTTIATVKTTGESDEKEDEERKKKKEGGEQTTDDKKKDDDTKKYCN